MKNQIFKFTMLSIVFVLCNTLPVLGQNSSINLDWFMHTTTGEILCKGCDLETVNTHSVPYFTKSFTVKTQDASVSLLNQKYKPILNNALRDEVSKYIQKVPHFTQERAIQRKEHQQIVKIFPFKIENDTLKRLVSFDVAINEYGEQIKAGYANNHQRRWASNSVLQNGEWFKIKVTENGVHSLSADFLKSLGIPINDIDPKTIKVYGNHGGMLPELNSDFRNDDLVENAIFIQGELDGKFDGSDYLLFYAEHPDKWKYNSLSKTMDFEKNIYTNESYYFITYGGLPGKRIQTTPANTQLSPDITFTNFDDFQMYHKDLYNNLKSGRRWLGDKFDATTTRTYSFSFPNLVKSEKITLKVEAVARSLFNSNFEISANGTRLNNYSMAALFSLSSTGVYHSNSFIKSDTFTSNSDDINVQLKYIKPSSNSIGWLDYLSLQAKRALTFDDKQTIFYNLEAPNHSVCKYRIESNAKDYTIWNVTDPFNIKQQALVSNSGSHTFNSANNGQFEKFISFSTEFKKAEALGKVENQNLHGLASLDYLVITHENFLEAAEELVAYRENQGVRGKVVLISQIYNEYSSGAQDMIAVRDFIKSVYDKGTGPNDLLENVLLFGDASYDFKDRISGNTNYVITYESYESNNYIGSYCSNDYFAFLDPSEGNWESSTTHKMDVNIGRIPVDNLDEAKAMVNKIKVYESTNALGAWRNKLVYAADDSDLSWDPIHLEDAENIYKIAHEDHKEYNNYKVYLDAYEQKSIGNANRYPEATADFTKHMNQGALAINYTGHGGEQGLAEERLLDIPTVNSWTNINNMPLFITATCEFSRYDDPGRVSAGELCLLNPNGGMIGLLTTVRVVTVSPNQVLNRLIWEDNLLNDLTQAPTLGDVFTKCKNLGNDYGHRNFTLLGDPALRLNYPKHEVVTDSINGFKVTEFNDSLGALDLVTISGHIESKTGAYLSQFNGTLYPIVFDKEITQKNLQNDDNAIPQEFKVQNEILFKGKVQVKDGYFSFSFILPKDINYNFGESKISYYADNGDEDAHGYYNGLIIGGSNPDAPIDTIPPKVEIWMDDYSFKIGGITDNSPLLIAKVFDESGINTSTSGIGREIIGIIDKGTENEKTYILNDYYESFLNSYKEGEVRFDLSNLSNGKHTMHVKYWDTYNNSAEGYTEFVVSNEEALKVENVYNYPNPFKGTTTFSFDHNQAGEDLKVELCIYDNFGKKMFTVSKEIKEAPTVVQSSDWEELKYISNYLSPGLYFYELNISVEGLGSTKKNGKIICIN